MLTNITPEEEPSTLALPDLLDVALQSSPATRITWANAKSSAARWGISKSDYYPQIDVSGDAAAGEIPTTSRRKIIFCSRNLA